MSETIEDYKTLALHHAILLVRELEIGKIPNEQLIAAKAHLVNRLFNTILYNNDLTGTEIKKIIDENK